MNPWMLGRAEVVRSHYPAQRVRGALLRIAEEGRNAGERLLLLGVEHMRDGADRQGVTGLLPMRPPLQRTFRIDQDVGEVLHVADLVRSLAHLQERVVAGGTRIGRVE